MCAAFGLAVLEAKTEITCLRTEGMSESTAIFSIQAAGQVHNQMNEFLYLGGMSTKMNEFLYLGGMSTKMPTRPSRSTGAYATHDVASGSTHSNCTSDRALPSSSKSGC